MRRKLLVGLLVGLVLGVLIGLAVRWFLPVYWVTLSSGVVHTSTCRHAERSIGQWEYWPDGRDCKRCGGRGGLKSR